MIQDQKDNPRVKTEFVMDYIVKNRKQGAFIFESMVVRPQNNDTEEANKILKPALVSWNHFFIVKLERSGPSKTRIQGGFRKFCNS